MMNSVIEKQIFSFNETKTVDEIVELSKIAGIEYDQKALECEDNLECFDDLSDNREERPIENVVAQDYNFKHKVSAEKVSYGTMARNKDISVDVRNLVIRHWKDGKSVRCIGQILKLSKSTVLNIIRRFKKASKDQGVQGHLENMKRWIVRQVKFNPRTSAVK
ncbi:hypothetical protein AVEN_10936-1 [Araneus ventricosus]|uniref:Sleeping Beauty transposase HTH domain-containing protein n=1 Tax=Araneus ventricosus TaxID=182803 RepID=A0A4Y2IHH6_ARAVE|nr:hypothetical protein AVEN_10936-1 [Araneus ventricosus]